MWLGYLERGLDRARMHPVWRSVSDALGELCSLLLPTECVVCELPDSSLCTRCAAELRRASVRPFRAELGAEGLPVAQDGPHGLSPTHVAEFSPLPVVAAGYYAKSLSAAILAFKNHGHTDVARWLQAALAGALHDACRSLGPLSHGVLLVPVPPHGASIRRRGYDPLGLLLGGLSRRRELPAGAAVIRAVRQKRNSAVRNLLMRENAQKSLGRRGRRRVLGSMEAVPGSDRTVRDRPCLIVDDVLTTGATIAETTRVLRMMGAVVIGAVVIAATPAPRGKDGATPEAASVPPPRSGSQAGVEKNPWVGVNSNRR